MQKKLIAVLSLGLVMVFCFVNGVNAKEKTWTLKVNTMAGAADRGCTILGAWHLMDRIEKETNGRVKYKKFPGQQLAKPPEIPFALKRGIIDVHFTGGTSFYTGIAPEIGFNMVPGVIDTYEVADRIFKDPEVYGIMNKAWNKVNGHWLTYVPGPGQMYLLNKVVTGLVDFKGLRLGSSGGMFDKFANLLGAAVVTVPPTERYTAMQTKTIDGITGMYFGLEDYKWGEVTKCAVLPYLLLPNVYGAVIRKNLWDEFPEDIKAGIQRACEWHWLYVKDWITNYMDKFEDPVTLKKYGITVVTLGKDDREQYQKAFVQMEDIFAKQSLECKRLIDIYRTKYKKFKNPEELIKEEASRYKEYGR